MPFVEIDVEAEIKKRCEKSSEFKRLWEEREKERNENQFFADTIQGICEAIEIEKGNVPLTERKDIPAKTYYVDTNN